jgi:uncharacterized protein (DUF433 family)
MTTDTANLLKPTEAAVVSGVELSLVNHAIDRGWLPKHLVQRGKGRRVSARACFYIAFYHGSAANLTADERRFAIFTVEKRADSTGVGSLHKALLRHCRVDHDWLQIDLKPFLNETHKRWDRYITARAMVTSQPDVLGGTPVIKGTRVPVYDVAASVAAEMPVARILEAYPSLSENQVELASLYAKANPPQGRPVERLALAGTTVKSTRVVERRRPIA